MLDAYFDVMPRFKLLQAGHPVTPRNCMGIGCFAFQMKPGDYWIARSSRAMTKGTKR
jgi:hypothetical protein